MEKLRLTLPVQYPGQTGRREAFAFGSYRTHMWSAAAYLKMKHDSCVTIHKHGSLKLTKVLGTAVVVWQDKTTARRALHH